MIVEQRLVTGPILRVFLANFGALTSFYLLISVVPAYTVTLGATDGWVGLTTAALMLATVLAELVTPRLAARFGNRVVLATGLVLLGVPAVALPLATDMVSVLAACLVRGVGFAIVMVVAGALVAQFLPPERRGEGLGVSALVAGVPAVVGLPAGLWLVELVGYGPVFVIAALFALVPLVVLPGLPAGGADDDHAGLGMLAGLRSAGLVRPALIFSATAMAAGITVTFLPLAAAGWAGPVALLVQSITATAARWWAGRLGDRHGPALLLVPSLLLAAAGLALLVLGSSPVLVIAGMALFGAGFGACQSATLAIMLNRVPASGFGTVSALWNMGYDAGYGAGAAGFGVLAAASGYEAAWGIVAVLVLAMVAPARRDRRA